MENEQSQTEKGNEQLKSARKELFGQLKKNQYSLIISRVPKNTKIKFIELANAEFCGDFGMTLKFLIDDLISPDTKMIVGTLQDHEARLSSLENNVEKQPVVEQDPSVRRMANGSMKRVKR